MDKLEFKKLIQEELSKLAKPEKIQWAPKDKEHLSQNKDNLNKELMRRWINKPKKETKEEEI